MLGKIVKKDLVKPNTVFRPFKITGIENEVPAEKMFGLTVASAPKLSVSNKSSSQSQLSSEDLILLEI